MSFKTVSAILRGRWLLDKQWAAAHMPVIMNVLNGKGSFKELMSDFDDDEDDEEQEEKRKTPQLVLSNKAGSVYKVNYYTDFSRLPEGSIAMLTIAGPVAKYGGMCSYGMVDHAATVKRVADSANIKGLIINIDSPGGEAAGTALFAQAISDAGKIKPVISLIDDGIAASAGMWIASAANEIYVTQKTDMVGSIGVYTTIADWSAHYLEYWKLPIKEIYAPQSVDKNKDYYDALKGEEDGIKNELKVLAQEFIDTVAANRAGKIQGTEWQTGKMYYAKDAIKLGLIDGIKTLDQVIRRMDTLIKNQNSNSNTMAFEKTLKAAKAESFEVVDGGFLLSEDQLNNIEAAQEASETTTARVTELEGQVAAAQTAQQTAEAGLATANTNLATANASIETLQARVTELEGEDAKASDTGKGKDEFANAAAEMPDFEKELRAKID